MKITVISLDNWGFNSHLYDALVKDGHKVNHIDFNQFVYKYPNVLFKIYNFFLKSIFKKNLKNIYYGKEIIARLREINEIQDVILTIKGDFIDPKSIKDFKKYSNKSIGYFNDSIDKCPKIATVIPSFDEVYSFEKKDCKKYNLKFVSNWIFNSTNNEDTPIEDTPIEGFKYDVFNISSKDCRLNTILNIAAELKRKDIHYKILVLDKKNKNNDAIIEYIPKKLSLSEVDEYIKESKALLDINHKNQEGLTFRVFESIGLHKKLITTNAGIKNYDFYNPKNIFIIEDDFKIDKHFFDIPYEAIPENIYKKYTAQGWLEKVIFQH